MLPSFAGMRSEAKMRLKLNLARDAKNKKGFYSYVREKWKVKENALSPTNTTSKLVTTDETAEVLINFFTSVFTGNLPSHTSPEDELEVKRDHVRNHLRNLNVYKFI